MIASTYIQSGGIIGSRIAFFLAAQRLLHTFNPALRDIASDVDPANGTVSAHGSPGMGGAGYIDHAGASRSGDSPGTPYSDGGYDDSEPVTRAGTPDIEMTAPILRLNHSQLVSGAAIREAKERRRGTRRMGRVARILFSACFAEACTLLGLVIAHELGALDAVWQFSISLHILLALVLLVLPFAQCLLFTYGGNSGRRKSVSTATTPSRSSLSLPVRLLVAIVPYTLYIFIFTRLPPYITVHVDADGDGVEDWASWAGWVAPAMGRLVFMGVICLGGLSGFGAVRTAWMFWERTRISDTLTEETIMQAERSLWRVRQDIASKEAEPTPERRSSWRNVFIGGGSSESELAGLQVMERQAAHSLAVMKQRMSRQVFAQTFGGKVFGVVGKVFGVYCAARVLMCLPSLFLSTSAAAPENGTKGNSNGDWISFMLAFLLSHLPIPLIDVEAVDIPVWSRAISLGFTGLIILSSLAQVLRSLRRALKLTSKSVGASFLLLTLGQLFATYIISLLTQLRATIPEDDDLLATLPDFRIFGRLFDVVFLGAAFATLLYRFISIKVEF